MLPPSIRRTVFTTLAVTLAAGQAWGQGNNPPAPATLNTADALNQINLQLKALGEKLDRLDATATRINGDMAALRDDVSAVKAKSLQNETELRRLNDELTALKNRLDNMNRSGTSSSLKVNPTAKVRFANKYTTDMTVYLNGTTFTVPANEEREVPVAAGSVVYQILGYQASAKFNTLSDNQMLTVTLRPAY